MAKTSGKGTKKASETSDTTTEKPVKQVQNEQVRIVQHPNNTAFSGYIVDNVMLDEKSGNATFLMRGGKSVVVQSLTVIATRNP